MDCTFDFETASACDLTKAGAWRYAEDPTTEVICARWRLRGQRMLDGWRPGGDLRPLMGLAINPNIRFVAHNVQFEKAIWRKIMVPMFGMTDIPNTRWHDTMAVAAMKAMPQDLDLLAKALRLGTKKDTEGRKTTLALSKYDKRGNLRRDQGSLDTAYTYCGQDVEVEEAALERLGELSPGSPLGAPPERDVWLLNQRLNERGLRLDMRFIEQAQKIVDAGTLPMAARFAALTGLGVTQGEKFKDWLHAQGLHLDNLTAETVKDFFGLDEDEEYALPLADETPAREALRIRQMIGSASVKKLAAMRACVSSDGRARGLLQYHGTGPGRDAGRLLQPTNLPRPTLKVDGSPMPMNLIVDAILTGDAGYVEMVVGPPVETVVSGLRHAIVADPGRVLLSGDYAGIQARVVLALAGQHDKTELMASGADVYCDMASVIFGYPVLKKQHPVERQLGKNAVLGLGFQMGAAKFKLKYGKDQTLEFIQGVVDAYRRQWAPLVPKVWEALNHAATMVVWHKLPREAYGVRYQLEDGWLTVTLPSGRKIWYWDPQPVKRAMPWDDTDIRLAFTYKAKKTGRYIEINAFGGLLTENVVMGIERDIMVRGALKLEANGFPVILNVYDEVLTEPKKEDADEAAFRQILLDSDQWVKDLLIPLEVETWCGDRYRK